MSQLLDTCTFNKKARSSNEKRALAGPTRLELATSALTGQRSNQLSYDPKTMFVCGLEGNRTPDLVNAIQALSQLSYEPVPNGSDKIRVIYPKKQTVFLKMFQSWMMDMMNQRHKTHDSPFFLIILHCDYLLKRKRKLLMDKALVMFHMR